MYSIFRPLDLTERLPREVMLERAQYRRLYLRDVDLALDLFLPALLITFVVLASFGLQSLLAFGLALLAVTGLYATTVALRRHRRVRP